MNFKEKTNILEYLNKSDKIIEIQKALLPLINFYPKCPLAFIYPERKQNANELCNLNAYKKVVAGLYEKKLKSTVMVKATLVYLEFLSGKLKVKKGLVLSNFQEIERYPETELSKKVAASISSAIITIFNMQEERFKKSNVEWSAYFWNQGMKIDECYFG